MGGAFMRKKIAIEPVYDAALRVFAEFGYRKATVDDIAGALGMTKSNLYLYVENKKDLYEKSVCYALIKWQNKVRDAILGEATAEGQFFVMCRKAIDYLDDAPELRAILKRDPDIFPMFPIKDPYERINGDSVRMIRMILENGIRENVFRPVNAEKVSAVIFSIYKMFIIRTYICNDTDRETIRGMFDDTLDLATRGLFLSTKEGRR
jgi:AcrR family transcriptional regulator